MKKRVECRKCHLFWIRSIETKDTFDDTPDFSRLYLESLCPECLQYFKDNSTSVIHEQQAGQGFEQCFGTKKVCDQLGCCYRMLCLAEHHRAKEIASV